jgi:hypothetical protein
MVVVAVGAFVGEAICKGWYRQFCSEVELLKTERYGRVIAKVAFRSYQ